MKRIISMSLCLLLVITMTACSAETKQKVTVDNEVTHFKLGYVNSSDSPIGAVVEKMNELLSERLPGYVIDAYPSGQLGGERDMIESTQLGIQDLCITATTPLVNFVPSMTPGELLYLIKDYEHADRVYQEEIGQQWLKDCRDSYLVGLGFTEVGFRQLCSNEPIEMLSDLDGVKLRVMESKAHVNGWKSLGVDAITMGWSDAYAGVQQKTIDALEVPYCLAYANSVYEVCDYIAQTDHIYTAQVFIMSENAWGQMTQEEQKIWMECAQEACAYGREFSRKAEKDYMEKIKAEGVTITTPDMSGLEEELDMYYDSYLAEHGDVIEEIKTLAQ